MKESTSVTKDPVCGMTVDKATAPHAERDGKTFYFCCDHCRQKFLSTPTAIKPTDKPGCCCGKKAANGHVISAANNRVACRVVRTDEERMIARSVTGLLSLGTPEER